MTHATPPGWYPDPGHTGNGPATERWWNGTAWTEQTRPAGGTEGVFGPPAPPGAPAAPGTPPTVAGAPTMPGSPMAPGSPTVPGGPGYPGQPSYPAYPAYPGQPPAKARGRARTAIAVVAGVAVLAAIGGGVYALTRDGGGTDKAGSGSPFDSPRETSPDGPGGSDGGGSGGSGGEDGPGGPGGDGEGGVPVEGGPVHDSVNGISIPVPDGWQGGATPNGAGLADKKTYPCPSDPSQDCTPGGASSASAEQLGLTGVTSAKEAAQKDIGINAEESYGAEGYGALTSHQVLKSGEVTVAGQKGYLVRWKAVTQQGTDGCVESLAFPSPADPDRIVVIRFGVDIGQDLSVIDEITKGIEKASVGGNGQSV